MSRYIYLVMCVLAITLAGCTRSAQPELAPLTLEEISGARLWTRIAEESDYRQYGFLPGHEGIRPGQSPHGRLHRVYVNNTLEDALPIADRTAPPGTIIVKENLTARRDVDALTVMAKVTGFNAEGADWFWAKYDPTGKVLAEGTPEGCIQCHQGMADNDFVVIRSLDAPVD